MDENMDNKPENKPENKMSNKNRATWVVVVIIVIAIIIYGVMISQRNNSAVNQAPASDQSLQTQQLMPAQNPQPSTPSLTTLTVTLNGQNNSGEMGTTTLTDVSGKTKVVLNYTGAPKDIVQPAHIHTGSCANLGGVVYPLNYPVNGASETTLDVSIDQLLSQLPLAINVHKSAGEITVYTACGDIKNTTAVAPTTPAPAQTQPKASQPQAATPAPAQPSTGGYGY
jgi:hypothetical protein